jgi:predicted nucleotidyltransferase
MLPDSLIQSLITRLDNPDVVGITYAGSYARGQAGPYSDVDLQIYVHTLPETHYNLQYWDGRLVSLSFNTVEAEGANLLHPEHALWAVPGLRQAVILLDKDGSIARLKQSAIEFEWAALQALADQYALEELMGFAEEIHKILNGLLLKHESTVFYANWGLVRGLGRAVAVQRGLLMETENRFFEIIQDSVGPDSTWTQAFRLAMGAEIRISTLPYISRGIGALKLYRETAALFKLIITEQHRPVIEMTLEAINSAGY